MTELQQVADQLRMLRQSRSQLAGKRDPVSRRNVATLSIKIRELTARHAELIKSNSGTDTNDNQDPQPSYPQ